MHRGIVVNTNTNNVKIDLYNMFKHVKSPFSRLIGHFLCSITRFRSRCATGRLVSNASQKMTTAHAEATRPSLTKAPFEVASHSWGGCKRKARTL